jgi:hypothetical protein
MAKLELRYDHETGRATAHVQGTDVAGTDSVQLDKITFRINKTKLEIVSFEIDDFRYFVSYPLVGRLFGDEVIRGLSSFQSVVASGGATTKVIDFKQPTPSARREVQELLRAA